MVIIIKEAYLRDILGFEISPVRTGDLASLQFCWGICLWVHLPSNASVRVKKLRRCWQSTPACSLSLQTESQ